MATATLGLSRQGQASFASGAFPGLEAIPQDGAEDIINAVIADDGSLYRRGGSSYVGSLSATNTRPFYNLWAGYLGTVGKIVVASRLQGTTVVTQEFSVMAGSASDFTGLFAGVPAVGPQRATAHAGMVTFVGPAVPFGPGVLVTAYGGGTASDLAQTVSLTEGSKLVTGVGSTFTALTPGMLMHRDATTSDGVGVVESIQSDTQLTLLRPWAGTGTIGVDFTKTVQLIAGEESLPFSPGSAAYSASIVDRFIAARGNRIAFAYSGFATLPTDYHELPYGATVTGLEPLGDRLMVFSTGGVFAISGLAYDLTDAFGNVQQRLDHVAPNVVLWDNRGIAGWRGAIVAPCVDDVYIVESASSLKPIGGGIKNLYRSYVHQGFQLGQACVSGGRYILPVLNGNAWVDTLVCDLRSGAWTRWNGNGVAVSSIVQVVGDDSRQPRLFALGASGSTRRVHDLSTVLDETGSSVDADGTSYDVEITTRTLTAPGLLGQLWRRLRARFETEGSVQVELGVATGRPGSSFENVNGQQVSFEAGEQVWAWPFSLRSRSVRFRLTVSSSSREVLRAFEVFSRPSGKP